MEPGRHSYFRDNFSWPERLRIRPGFGRRLRAIPLQWVFTQWETVSLIPRRGKDVRYLRWKGMAHQRHGKGIVRYVTNFRNSVTNKFATNCSKVDVKSFRIHPKVKKNYIIFNGDIFFNPQFFKSDFLNLDSVNPFFNPEFL